MKYMIPLLCLVASVVASVDFSNWHPPHNGEVRSPCPVLNSLANHDILPRDGLNYSVPMLVKALGEAINVSSELATSLATLGVGLGSNPADGTFDLDDLEKHNALEHDASLSRKDYDLGGQDQAFCPQVFNETLSFYNGATDVGIPEVAAARWGRIQSSKANNPQFVYGEKQRFPSYFESGSYYQLFMNPATKEAPVKWIEILFREERMPYNEGWRPINRIDGLSVADVNLQLALHTPEKLPVSAES